MICYAKNVENHATFVEGFSPEFNPRRRFMKHSMSAPIGSLKGKDNEDIFKKKTFPLLSSTILAGWVVGWVGAGGLEITTKLSTSLVKLSGPVLA